MTDKEQYELIGKIVSEFAQKQKDLEMLRVKVGEIGRTMISVGGQVARGLEFLVFSGESTDLRFMGQTPVIRKEDLVSLDVIINLRNQIRTNIIELERLQEQKKGLGI